MFYILIFYLSATKIKWNTFAYLGDYLESSANACHDDVANYNWLLKAMDYKSINFTMAKNIHVFS